jgi:hypothetical protein
MIEKLFRLNSESSRDLEELSYSFQEGPATVKKIEDFYWLILQFDSEKPDEQALEEARNALSRMSAICLVQDERFRSPTVAGVARRDPVTGKIIGESLYVALRGIISTTAVGRPTITEADGTVVPRQPTFGEQALPIVEKNAHLRAALRAYSAAGDRWGELYKVLETIQKANKGKIPWTWATEREIDDFGQAANNPSDDPTTRHGYDPDKAKESRMTIPQGRALIQKILNVWINELISTEGRQSS